MTTTGLLTFEKTISPGVTVCIRNIPGRIGAGGERDYRKQFIERRTAHRIEHLMNVARGRIADGETDVHLDYAEDV
ncbi:MAG: hypothetical protein JWM87_3701 [Candidatus Eremiobacteraeota bacterium]|nr:hypothetical protein [Candidatus Eremiobacteraeota bacterium]